MRWMLFLAGVLLVRPVWATQAEQTLSPIADAFVRELAPEFNYGGGGGLSVGGPQSVNGAGQLRGRSSSAVKFDAFAAIAGFDSLLGPGTWHLTALDLRLDEVGAPPSGVFPRGAGLVELDWISADAWSEGDGTPNAPQPGEGAIITWNYLQTMLAGATITPLATFQSLGADGTLHVPLPLSATLVNDILAGAEVTLYFHSASDTVGFTFHSRSFDPDAVPLLTLTAATEYAIGDLNCDATVNNFDIDAFVLALTNEAGYAALFPHCDRNLGDINRDGLVNNFDIDPFVLLLTH